MGKMGDRDRTTTHINLPTYPTEPVHLFKLRQPPTEPPLSSSLLVEGGGLGGGLVEEGVSGLDVEPSGGDDGLFATCDGGHGGGGWARWGTETEQPHISTCPHIPPNRFTFSNSDNRQPNRHCPAHCPLSPPQLPLSPMSRGLVRRNCSQSIR
jgi:hypothetical protein